MPVSGKNGAVSAEKPMQLPALRQRAHGGKQWAGLAQVIGPWHDLVEIPHALRRKIHSDVKIWGCL
jgi:hypothetical protein